MSTTLRVFLSARNAELLQPGNVLKAFQSPKQDQAVLGRATPSFQSVETLRRRQLASSRKVFELGGAKYYRATTSINISKLTIAGSTASVSFESTDHLYFGPGVEDYTGQVAGWEATFERADGSWAVRLLKAKTGGYDQPLNEPLPSARRTSSSMSSLERELQTPLETL